jgi:ABC-type uncharacterized transport system substrate-binding protein
MRRLFLVVISLLVVGALPASAHPHVFINNRMTVMFDGGWRHAPGGQFHVDLR